MKFAATLILVVFCAAAQGSYPKLDVSFSAEGEVTVQVGPLVSSQVKIEFEECFDRAQNHLALELEENGIKNKIIEDLSRGQAFRYDHRDKCQSIENRYKDLQKIYLQAVETASGHVVFPIRQLMTLNEEFLVNATAQVSEFMGVVADKWAFLINETNDRVWIDAFWSAASTGKVEPLGFRISRTVHDTLKNTWDQVVQDVAIKKFKHGEVDFRDFIPRRGVFCEGSQQRREGFSQLKDFVKGKVQKIHDKVKSVAKKFKSIGALDTWFDSRENVFRFNYAPVQHRISKGVQRIVSHVQDVVYEFNEARECAVKKAKANPFDLENIFEGDQDIKDFLSIDKVDYISIGETVEGQIPCELYQAQRTDWPTTESAGTITTVWEWCLANKVSSEYKVQINGAPLVSLNIYITESPYTNTSKSFYYKGLRLAYNFYNVRNTTHEYLENLAVDIKECFQEANLKRLQFRAKIHDAVKKALITRHLKTLEHLSAWREAVSKAAKVQTGSLRVAELQLRVDEQTNELEVSFTLLGRHPDIPEEVEEIPLETAVENVQKTVDEGQVAVDVQLEDPTQDAAAAPQEVNLMAEPGTLRAKREVIVAPDADTTTTAHSGLSAGTVAAVAVAMLALGVAVGTVAIFLRKRKSHDYQKL